MNDYSSSPQLTQPTGGGGAGIWIALGLLGLLVLAGGVGVGGYFFWKQSQEEDGPVEDGTTTSIGTDDASTSGSNSGSTGSADAGTTGSADAGNTTASGDASSGSSTTTVSSDAGTISTSGTTASNSDGDTKAVDTKAVDTKAVDTKAVDTKAVDTKAVDTKEDAKEEDAKVPTKGEVTVTGGARVRLVGSKGAFAPGKVPAGSYVIQATFKGGPERAAGKITVTGGGKHTIVCSPATEKCSVR